MNHLSQPRHSLTAGGLFNKGTNPPSRCFLFNLSAHLIPFHLSISAEQDALVNCTALSLISLTSATPYYYPTAECPLLGPNFSPDFDLGKTDAFARAKAAFPGVIEELIKTGVVTNTTSFVIDLYLDCWRMIR